MAIAQTSKHILVGSHICHQLICEMFTGCADGLCQEF